MQKFIFIGMLFVVQNAVGCTLRGSEPGGESSARLVGGTVDTGDPAVVLFQVTGDDGGECTAEFISTTVLLSAAHCVVTESGTPLSDPTFRIYRGNDFANAGEQDWITIDPTNVHAHPSFVGDDHDIAVLVLSEPVDVTPLPFSAQALSASDVGKSVRLVGYGSNVPPAGGGDDGFGIKRELTTTIVGVEPSWVEVGEAGKTACSGDSGGPALLEIDGVETIIGLDSFSDAEADCTASEFYQRVDTETEFIAKFMTTPSGGTGGSGGGVGAGGAGNGGSAGGVGGDVSDSEVASGSDTSGGCAIGVLSGKPSSGSALALVVVMGLALGHWRRQRFRAPRHEGLRARVGARD